LASSLTCWWKTSTEAPTNTTSGASQADRLFLSIRFAKTGRNQSVELKDGHTIHLLRELIKKRNIGDTVFTGGAAHFRKTFRTACEALKLVGYTPHSLRHGGATHAYMGGMRIEDVMVHGRWAANKSARTYIQTSRAALIAARSPASTMALGQQLAAHPSAAMRAAHGAHLQTKNEHSARSGRAAYAGRLGQ
jgi:hypothetical protein